MTQVERFEDLFRRCFRRAMTDVLGQSGADAMFVFLKLGDGPYEPKDIDEKLTHAFRRDGARVIERQALKLVFDEMVERFDERSGFSFAKNVELAKSQYRTAWGVRRE